MKCEWPTKDGRSAEARKIRNKRKQSEPKSANETNATWADMIDTNWIQDLDGSATRECTLTRASAWKLLHQAGPICSLGHGQALTIPRQGFILRFHAHNVGFKLARHQPFRPDGSHAVLHHWYRSHSRQQSKHDARLVVNVRPRSSGYGPQLPIANSGRKQYLWRSPFWSSAHDAGHDVQSGH